MTVTLRPFAIAVVVASLVLAACGGSDPIELSAEGEPAGAGAQPSADSEDGTSSEGDPEPAPVGEPESNTTPDPQPDSTATPDTEPDADGEDPLEVPVPDPDVPEEDRARVDGWTQTTSMTELVDPRVVGPEEFFVTDDDLSVVVRYQNAVEPCSGARVTLNETDEFVEVVLETGLHPNAAAMTCIAMIEAYQITEPLSEVLGDRLLVAKVQSENEPTDGRGERDGATFASDYYVGLTLGEAEALAETEQRPFRVGRIDGERFPLTRDYRPDRVTVEVDDGIVVSAVGG